jgi:uncharacterized integral membrane protein
MARHSRTVGAIYGAYIAWAQCVGLSIGGMLNLVAHMRSGTILDILADEATNTWFVVMIILLGVCALTLHRYDDVQRVLTWIAFGWFVLGALVLGCGGGHL